MLKRYLHNTLYAAALLSFATACEPEIERDVPNYEEARGDADFSVYVALGNSLTAGYADNALYREGQLNSYPAIIAEKIDYVAPDFEFIQPLLPEGNGIGFLGDIPIGRLNLVSTSPLTLSPTAPSSGWEAPVEGPIHNLGVPGAKVGHLLAPGYGNPSLGAGNFNPYYARFASSPSASVVEQAIALNPTFFTLWIGNNDVLGYALAGGEGTITPVPTFRQYYQAIIQSLVAARPEIEGALANIPDVSKIPYVSTILYNQLALTADQAAQANAAYQAMIEPGVRASVDSVAKTRVIRGVIEEGARREIRTQVRPVVATAVATNAVYQTAYQTALASGANDEQAKAQAQAYVESTEGQNDIKTLETALLNGEGPAPAQEAFNTNVSEQVEIQLATTAAQSRINAAFNAAINSMDNLVPVLGTEGAAAVNMVFSSEQVVAQREAGFNQTVTSLKAAGFYPVFVEGPNAFVIQDENPANPLGIRQMVNGEKVLLSAMLEGQLAPETAALPKPDHLILDLGELGEINEAIAAYNAIIAEVAENNTLALVDMNAFFDDVADDGLTADGTSFTSDFISGNAFSLDGVHLTQKGYALVAQQFISKINEYYNSDIPLPKLQNYPAVALP